MMTKTYKTLFEELPSFFVFVPAITVAARCQAHSYVNNTAESFHIP